MTSITMQHHSPICGSASPHPIRAWEKAIYVCAFALLVAARIPAVFTSGRFWAEDGTIFFANARHLRWYKALLSVFGGYLELSANLAGVLARYLTRLDYACYVTSIFGLVIQTFPAVLLCTSKQPWLQDRKILVASLLLVATMPFSYEVWLSAIGSQCHLNLCAVLILALETPEGLAAAFRYALLVLAPLSGPGALFLLPLFIARAAIERSRPRAAQASVLGLASILQIVLSLHAKQRALGIDPLTLANAFFLKHIFVPLMGQAYSYPLDLPLHNWLLQGHAEVAIATIAVFVIFGIAVWKAGNAAPLWFFLSGMVLSTVSYFGALGDRTDLLYSGGYSRYVFAPQISFELALLCLSCMTGGWTRLICRAVVVWIVVIGLHDYFLVPARCSTGPAWSAEVRAWRKDPRRLLRIWPPGWYVQLNPTPSKGY